MTLVQRREKKIAKLIFFFFFFFFCETEFEMNFPFPSDVWGKVWNSTVSVPDQCLFIYLLFILFRIALWPSAGKELSPWLFTCVVFILMSS